jgi:hypothetical protein
MKEILFNPFAIFQTSPKVLYPVDRMLCSCFSIRRRGSFHVYLNSLAFVKADSESICSVRIIRISTMLQEFRCSCKSHKNAFSYSPTPTIEAHAEGREGEADAIVKEKGKENWTGCIAVVS